MFLLTAISNQSFEVKRPNRPKSSPNQPNSRHFKVVKFPYLRQPNANARFLHKDYLSGIGETITRFCWRNYGRKRGPGLRTLQVGRVGSDKLRAEVSRSYCSNATRWLSYGRRGEYSVATCHQIARSWRTRTIHLVPEEAVRGWFKWWWWWGESNKFITETYTQNTRTSVQGLENDSVCLFAVPRIGITVYISVY